MTRGVLGGGGGKRDYGKINISKSEIARLEAIKNLPPARREKAHCKIIASDSSHHGVSDLSAQVTEATSPLNQRRHPHPVLMGLGSLISPK